MDDQPSTNSLLGSALRECGLDREDLIDDIAQDQHTFVTLQNATEHIFKQEQQEILNLPDDLIFNLIEETDNPNQVVNFEVKLQDNKEGAEIMANLTGFGAVQPGPAMDTNLHKAYVEIVEEPAENKLRFRYECEGRSAGALHGFSSTNENKTYPTIKIVGYQGPAVCVVSLVEINPPYRVHPHKLVGKDGLCKRGVCSVEINNADMTYAFQNLGIQCVRKKDAQESLRLRQEIKVDPFKQGFDHMKGGADIDLNMVRLCFQVFLKTSRGLVPLQPAISSIIKDRKAHSDLQILEYSDDTSPVEGGKKILIFCEKVNKDDIEVHFAQYTQSGDTTIAKGEFTANDVHKQYGIKLLTPPFYNKEITEPARCEMFLYKTKSKATSEPIDFWYLPSESNKDAKINNLTKLNPMDIKPIKRSRAPKVNQDDPSSGQIIVPSKIPPAQLRGGGGQVIVTSTNQDQEGLGGLKNLNTYWNQQQQFSPESAAARPVTTKPYEHVALEGNRFVMRTNQQEPNNVNAKASPISIHDVHALFGTQRLANFGAQPMAEEPSVVAPVPNNEFNNGYIQGSTSEGVAIAQGLNEGFPNLNISGGDLGEMENLSANLDSNLKLSQSTTGKVQLSGYNDLGGQGQSSQLHTPEVSGAMSVDNTGITTRSNARRTNPNN